MNQIGFCEWCFPEKGPQVIVRIAELGANCIQIDDHGGKRSGYPLAAPAVQERYLTEAKKWGVEIVSLGANAFAKSGELVAEDPAPALETLGVYLDICRAMGIPNIMLPFFWRSYLKEDDEEKYRFAVAFLKQAGKMAEEYGVILAVETILSPEKALEMTETVDSDFVKIFYDIQNTWHFNSADPVEEMRKLGKDKISMIHIKDGTEEIIGGSILGEGSAGFFRSLDGIKNLGYTGALLLENMYNAPPLTATDMDPYEFARKDIEILIREVRK